MTLLQTSTAPLRRQDYSLRVRWLPFLGTLSVLTVMAVSLRADVSCPAIFSDHMVLQRSRPVALWGTADPGETVTAEFKGNRVSTQATKDGKWSLKLPALTADSTGAALSIRGKTTLNFRDVLVGEVWLCSGQSNMEKPFGARKGQKPTDDSEAEIAAAAHPTLRLYQVPHYRRAKPNSPTLQWVPCTPETLLQTEFSAVAYIFGRQLKQELGVPIGLIHASFGGTQIEAWIPASGFQTNPALAPLAAKKFPAWVDGVQATELYQSMIAPCVPYPVRGFLWYQGEANVMMADGSIYTEKMAALIASWRAAWRDAQAPFYFAQLAPFNYSQWDKFPKLLTTEALPVFWEAQAHTLAIPRTGMVVTTDLVANLKDIHPTNKKDVGLRFARLALADTYLRSGPEARSPEFASFRAMDRGRAELSFKHTGGRLSTSDGKAPTDFLVAGADQAFFSAQAQVQGDKVIVWSDRVASPVAVRFAWHETAHSNLAGASGLPVVPFRTDAWPVVTERPKG